MLFEESPSVSILQSRTAQIISHHGHSHGLASCDSFNRNFVFVNRVCHHSHSHEWKMRLLVFCDPAHAHEEESNYQQTQSYVLPCVVQTLSEYHKSCYCLEYG